MNCPTLYTPYYVNTKAYSVFDQSICDRMLNASHFANVLNSQLLQDSIPVVDPTAPDPWAVGIVLFQNA